MKEPPCTCRVVIGFQGRATGMNPAGCPVHGLTLPEMEAAMNIGDERKDLICMREAEMRNRHQQADFTHVCAICLERVGIFPGGQAVIAAHALGMIRIVCSRCVDPLQYKVVLEANRDLDV